VDQSNAGTVAGRGACSRARGRGAALGAWGLAALAGLAGCETDSFFDVSQTGRFEWTPTKVPILTKIGAIEGDATEYVQYSDVTPEDLIPEVRAYRVGPGDTIQVVVWDIPVQGSATPYERLVDNRGFISIPELGELYVSGQTAEGVREVVVQAASRFVQNPLVDVQVVDRRQQTFNVFGAVPAPGLFLIPSPDYRLLEALAAARGFPPATQEIYVIRQVALTSEVSGVSPPPEGAAPSGPTDTPGGEKLIELIDELSKPPSGGGAAGGGGSPGVYAGSEWTAAAQPENTNPPEPAVDLVESQPASTQPQPPVTPPSTPESDTAWVFLDGKWVQVRRPSAAESPAAPGAQPANLVTQRVIRVPVKPLVAGDAKYNIVVRPGDLIRVPYADTGNLYMHGNVQRPGVYRLPEDGRLTLKRAITAAGGLSAIGIAERVDITRIVGRDMEATIRLNYRAIEEGTQPDIYLKPDDRINVGTNFWAYPVAVIRNGFRASYGFGFLLDRNFGNDVFGPPPTDRGREF